ncbi:MAG: hypothetical protein MUC36_03235 [Planctomycetes bacterium]|nr:hypothetical protein [Planctomycetota bacterium]
MTSAFRMPDLTRFDADREPGAGTADKRLLALLRELEQVDRCQPLTLAVTAGTLWARYPAGAKLAVEGSLLQIIKPEPVGAQLQLSVLTMPTAVAERSGLVPSASRALDEVAVGVLGRAATAAGGTLRNLPEFSVSALTPFTVPLQALAEGASAKERVAGELVPLDATTVLIAFDLLRDVAGSTEAPGKPLHVAARMQAGSVLVCSVDTESGQAIVVVMRCLAVAAPKPAPAPVPAPQGKTADPPGRGRLHAPL